MENLSLEEKLTLISIVKQVIEKKLFGNSNIQIKKLNSLEKRKQGAFVTLNKNQDLRGCMGLIETNKPLTTVIKQLAYSSAFEDPRFKPLNTKEYPHTWVEISLLSKPKTIYSSKDIIINKHGLIISSGPEKGLLLPQVASEHNWDRETFLEHTCIKASLPHDAWKHGAKIESFEAIVFDEKEIYKEYQNLT